MAALDRPEVRLIWEFSYDTQQGRFTDALRFASVSEYQATPLSDILQRQRDRRDGWLEALRQARINARQATRAELQAQKQALLDQAAALDAEIATAPA